jgi:CelD/BcsL family acetyltransferase involved in cellulose biosynthesis
MSVAGALEGSPLAEAAVSSMGAAPAFASVEVHADLEAALDAWVSLMPLALATPYQTPSLLKAWVDHVAPHEGVSPMIVVARDAQGRPVAVLPFGLRRRFGVRIASFLGGSHSNFNLPVLRRDRLALFTPAETLRLLRQAAAVSGADVFALTNQPYEWEGVANPFLALPGQPSPDPAFSSVLAADIEEHFRQSLSAKARSKQRRKMRRFEELGVPRIFRAETTEERARLLDAYLAQKGVQLTGRGITNVFGKPGVREFLADATGASGLAPAIDLYGFELNGEIIAVTGALGGGGRCSGMFNSISSGEHAKYSPGELLMTFVVEDAIRQGYKMFDLGVGVASYKKMYCPDTEPLFDSMLGVTIAGRAAAASLAAARRAKARIKANRAVYELFYRLRRMAAGRRGPSHETPPSGDAD